MDSSFQKTSSYSQDSFFLRYYRVIWTTFLHFVNKLYRYRHVYSSLSELINGTIHILCKCWLIFFDREVGYIIWNTTFNMIYQTSIHFVMKNLS